jgi:hypothetical protein
MRTTHLFAIVTGLLLVVGQSCRRLDLTDGFPCSDANTCPSPFTCQAGQCVRHPSDGGVGVDSGMPDSVADTTEAAEAPTDTTHLGGDGDTHPDGSTDSEPAGGDMTRPTILSASPHDGEKGVTSDTVIVITFSEPMDEPAVRTAYVSSTILPGQVIFNWNTAGTVLTIAPKAPWQYNAGNDLSLPASTFSYQIGTTATDLAGNALSSPITVTFSTLRRIRAVATAQGAFTLIDAAPYNGQVTADPCSAYCEIGQSVGPAFSPILRAYAPFPVPAPPQGLYNVESATLSAFQGTPQGNPYSVSSLMVDQIAYDSTPSASTNTAPAIRFLGVFATSGSNSNPSIDATATLQQAFAGSGNQIMFRFYFGALPSANSLAEIESNFSLSWIYLIP